MSINKIKRIILLCLVTITLIIPNYSYCSTNTILGDINKDGKVDSMDLLYIMRHIIAEGSDGYQDWLLKDERFQLADMTENGEVNSSDMLVLLRYIAASSNPEKIGKKHKEWLKLKNINTEKVETEIVKSERKDEIKKIEINKSLIEIKKGETEQLEVKIEPIEVEKEQITWRTVQPSIAEVDEKGKITGNEEGETLVIARSKNGKEAVSKVIVGKSVTDIELDKDEIRIDLSKERTAKVELKVKPEDASNKEVKVDTSDKKVAVVDSNGVIRGRENGEAELTFKAVNGVEKKIKVIVETSATGIKLDKNYVQLDLSEKKQSPIKATIEPNTASNKEITYMSSNEEIATVDKNGNIVAKSNGTVNIIARSTNGKEAVCKVEILTKATRIKMKEKLEIDLSSETEKELKIEVEPENASNKGIEVRSNNEEVVTIDGNGTVKAKKNGEATITATIVGTEISETCKVEVKTSATGIKLSSKEVNIDLNGNKIIRITAKLEPETASEKIIEWKNSSSEVVEMKEIEDGIELTGKKDGEAIITASIPGKDIKETAKISVGTSPTLVQLDKTNISIEKGKTEIVKATVTPVTASNKTIKWTNSDIKVVEVKETEQGIEIKGKKYGEAIITAETINGNIAQCKVKVSKTDISLDRSVVMLDNTYYNFADLEAKLTPNTTYKSNNITWKIKNTSVAKFKKDGKEYSTLTGSKVQVLGKGYGTTTITASLPNGNAKECKIRVITHAYNNCKGDRVYKEAYGKQQYINSNLKITKEEIEAYINNGAKIVKDYPNKFPYEYPKQTLYVWEAKNLDKAYNHYNYKKQNPSASEFKRTAMTKEKGQIDMNGYVLVFLSKNQHLYLLKKNSKGVFKLTYSQTSSGGYEIAQKKFDTYLATYYKNKEINAKIYAHLSISRQGNQKDSPKIWSNALHPGTIPGYPTSHGCIHVGNKMPKAIVSAGLGTKLIKY